MPSTPCGRFDVVLLPIPFTDLASRKVRPAIVAGRFGRTGDLLLVPITSQLRNIDAPLVDWQQAGLNVACGIKAQIATVEERLVLRVLGRLSAVDERGFVTLLRSWLGL